MKRIVSIALVVLALLPAGALAAGKLTTTQENFYAVDNYSVYGYAFARVENVGDKPVEYSAGLLEIYDANGDTLASDSYLSVYPKYLLPGEYGYVRAYENVDTAQSYTDVDDYLLTVTGKSSSGVTAKRFACETEWLPDFQRTQYSTADYMVATFTNDTDQTIFDIEVVLTLLDDEGNILDVEDVSLYSSIGVNPGSSVTVREEVNGGLREAYERAGRTATHVDAIAYVYVEE